MDESVYSGLVIGLILALVGVVVAVIGWIVKGGFSRIGILEKEKLDKDVFIRRSDQVRDDIKNLYETKKDKD